MKWHAKKASVKVLLWFDVLIKCRLKLILYPAGARGDFVCGWAGLLPTVIDNEWRIDPITGISQGNFETKRLDHGASLDDILKKQNILLDANSDLFYVAPCHGHNVDLNMLQTLVDSGTIQLYVIDVANADKSIIAWECIVKTYLSQRNTIFFEETHRSWHIDYDIDLPYEEITNQHRIDTVTHKAHRITVQPVAKFLTSSIITKLDYTKLFVPGGSSYFCDQLGLDAPQSCHNYWDQMLQFVSSPESINVWGHAWNKKDFFDAKRKWR